MDYKEFDAEIRKIREPKQFKVRGSFGVYDCYKLIRKNGWYDIGRPLKEHEFYSIIRGVNDLLAEEMAQGNTVVFPCRMGRLELRKLQVGVSLLDNGKLRNTYPIDWKGTLQLWFEDEESRNNKTLLRKEQEYTYFIRYDKYAANYENQSFYEFTVNRFAKQALYKNINKGKIDTLW